MQNAWEQIVMAVLAAYGALVTWAWWYTHNHSEKVLMELTEMVVSGLPRKGPELTCAILHCPLREELKAMRGE